MIPAMRDDGRACERSLTGRGGDILAGMRRVSLLPALVLACSSENPGFLLAGAGGSEATTAAASTGGATEAPTTTSTTTTTTGTGTTGEPLAACPAWAEPGIDWKFTYKGQPLAPANNCQPESFRGAAKLAQTSVQMGPDTNELPCGATVDGALDLTVGGFQFPPFVETCLEMEVAWDGECAAVGSALLWYYNPALPDLKLLLAVGVVGSQSPHPNTPKELTPTLQLVEACSCGPDAKECCEAADIPGPGDYRLRFEAADLDLGPGETTPPAAPLVTGNGEFSVTNLRTHVHANCVDSPLHVDWYATRK